MVFFIFRSMRMPHMFNTFREDSYTWKKSNLLLTWFGQLTRKIFTIRRTIDGTPLTTLRGKARIFFKIIQSIWIGNCIFILIHIRNFQLLWIFWSFFGSQTILSFNFTFLCNKLLMWKKVVYNYFFETLWDWGTHA